MVEARRFDGRQAIGRVLEFDGSRVVLRLLGWDRDAGTLIIDVAALASLRAIALTVNEAQRIGRMQRERGS